MCLAGMDGAGKAGIFKVVCTMSTKSSPSLWQPSLSTAKLNNARHRSQEITGDPAGLDPAKLNPKDGTSPLFQKAWLLLIIRKAAW
jgi:hypothetical protein